MAKKPAKPAKTSKPAKKAVKPEPAKKIKAPAAKVADKPMKAMKETTSKSAAKGGKEVKDKDREKEKNKENGKVSNEQRIKHALKKLTGGTGKNTPQIFKVPSKKNTPMVFSLGEVRQLIKEKSTKTPAEIISTAGKIKTTANAKVVMPETQQKPRTLKSATMDDLLGLGKKENVAVGRVVRNEADVPAKWMPYYKKLNSMREKLAQSVVERSEQTLRTSGKDNAGDLSSYSQHIADAGTDAFDTDFALSLVSSDQGMMREIDAAIDRIFNGTYGICEVTHKPISRDRLNAVPFTRFSKEGQDQYEKIRRRSAQRVGIASSEDDDGNATAGGEDDES